MAGNTKAQPQVLIHHLSDIFFGEQNGQDIGGAAALKRYVDSTVKLVDTEQFPDVIIITGNLTLTGSATDLTKMANVLSPLAEKMTVLPRQGIYIIPGTSDLYWTDPLFWTDPRTRKNRHGELLKQNYAEIRRIFGTDKYMLPLLFFPPRGVVDSPNYLVQLLNTCYPPVAEPSTNEKLLTPQEKLMRKLADAHFRSRLDEDTLLKAYAETLHEDIGWINTDQGGTLDALLGLPTAIDNRLRVLATHHPLMAYSTDHQIFRVPEHAEAVLQLSEERNFQLLLHGHTRHPGGLVASYPNTSGQSAPLHVQISGGQFLNVGNNVATYNKIVAKRGRVTSNDDSNNLPFLSLSLQIVPVATNADVPSSYFVLGNVANDLVRRIEDVRDTESQNAAREEFIRRSDQILRDLTALVHARAVVSELPPVDVEKDDDPSDAEWRKFQKHQTDVIELLSRECDSLLDQVKSMIRLLIFSEFDDKVSIGFLEKVPRVGAPVPPEDSLLQETILEHSELKFHYIMPTDIGVEFRRGLPYIATMAGWSLILGEIMTHPFSPEMTSIPVIRLFDTKKQKEVLIELKNYLKYLTAMEVSINAADITRLTPLVDLVQNSNSVIAAESVFMAPSTERNGPYKTLISVPVPIWSSHTAPVDEELGVLQIDLIEDLPSSAYLNDVRKEMLRGAADLVWLILTTFRSLRKVQNAISEREQVLLSIQEHRAHLASERAQMQKTIDDLEHKIEDLEHERDDLNKTNANLAKDLEYYRRKSDEHS